MGKYSDYNAAPVLERVEALIKKMVEHPYLKRIKITDVYEELSIFDWWPEYLSKSKLIEMRQFLTTAIALGYTGYVCFKVGATGCANGMWAAVEETETGYSPDGPTLYRSFTPAYTYWDITDKDGNWNWCENKGYDDLKTIKELKAFIERHADQVYRK